MCTSISRWLSFLLTTEMSPTIWSPACQPEECEELYNCHCLKSNGIIGQAIDSQGNEASQGSCRTRCLQCCHLAKGSSGDKASTLSCSCWAVQRTAHALDGGMQSKGLLAPMRGTCGVGRSGQQHIKICRVLGRPLELHVEESGKAVDVAAVQQVQDKARLPGAAARPRLRAGHEDSGAAGPAMLMHSTMSSQA